METFRVYLGIDVTSGSKPVTFVALDEDQQAIAIGEGDIADTLAFAAGQTGRALAAVNAAASPHLGRMKRDDVRRSLSPVPGKGKYTTLRQAEYELLMAGMPVHEAPASTDRGLPWVKRGFILYERLAALGYQPFQAEDTPRQYLEVQADSAFWSLLGVAPLQSGTLEGRIQRQLVLFDEDLPVPDAMKFFEEVTRFKILKSILPIKNIFPQNEINAWIAAHTAWLAAHHPQRIRSFGEPEEGLIYLPCKP